MKALTADGIPVNATLIFKLSQAIACAKAFKEGALSFGSKVDTVISVFVSRVDRAIDAQLEKNGVTPSLTGIYNSAEIYKKIEAMQVDGCRVLFASTGVKGDVLPAYYYIKNLLAYNSVDTAPVDTILSYVKCGETKQALPISQELMDAHFKAVGDVGINLEVVLEKQITEGLESFKDAFKEILEAL
jgi:transaldolase